MQSRKFSNKSKGLAFLVALPFYLVVGVGALAAHQSTANTASAPASASLNK